MSVGGKLKLVTRPTPYRRTSRRPRPSHRPVAAAAAETTPRRNSRAGCGHAAPTVAQTAPGAVAGEPAAFKPQCLPGLVPPRFLFPHTNTPPQSVPQPPVVAVGHHRHQRRATAYTQRASRLRRRPRCRRAHAAQALRDTRTRDAAFDRVGKQSD
jgi:hypothetical protein